MSEQIANTKAELLDAFKGGAEPGSPAHERMRLTMLVRCSEDIEARLEALTAAITDSGQASNRLARVGTALNVALVAATVVIAWGTWALTRR